MREPSRRYRVEFLQQLLDEKLQRLIASVQDKQKENVHIEDDVLQRLTLLKQQNKDVEQVFTRQKQSLAEAKSALQQIEEEHLVKGDDERLPQEQRLKELEKTLAQLRTEVEQAAVLNEKSRIAKEERSAHETNARTYADRKPNEQAREQLREVEEKRQNQRDQERDYNRDIYQLAKDYKRKVAEFNSLLLSYAAERNDLEHELASLSCDIQAEKSLFELEIQKAEKSRSQILSSRESIKALESQIQDKKKVGEDIYNQMRDQISF